MKKIFFIAIMSTSFLFSMNQDRSLRILLNDNGKLLKDLIDNEKSGHYIPELLVVEKTLQQYWEDITPKERSIYNKETQKLIQCIINRPQARKELCKAIEMCQHKQIQCIVKKNDYVIHAYDDRAVPMLEHAVIKNCKKCVKQLLACGVNVNAVNRYNQTALFSVKNADIFRLLHFAGALFDLFDNKQRSLLHHYVKNNNVACIDQFLYCNGKINVQDSKGNTALHKTIKINSLQFVEPDCLRMLLNYGASLDIPNQQGNTPFDVAILYGAPKTRKILKKHGYLFYHFDRVVWWENPYELLKNDASYFKSIYNSSSVSNKALAKFFIVLYCNERNIDNNATMMCTDSAFVVKKATFENLSCYFGQSVVNFVKTIIDKFIVKRAINVHKTNWLRKLCNTSFSLRAAMPDALHYVINNFPYSNFPIIPLLLDLDSDFTYCDEEGKTPLQAVEATGDQRLIFLFKQYLTEHLWQIMQYADKHKEVNLLLQHGADPRLNYDSIGGSLLFHHDLENHGCYAQELINAGVDINKGLVSPLRLAVKIGDFNYLILLLQNGARTSGDMEKIWLDILQKRKIDVIKAFIEKGVVVNNKSVHNNNNTEEIKNILREAYKNQECCVCLEHNDDLSYIPCKNIHANDFLCKRCYDEIQGNKLCPLCRKVMNKMLLF